MLSFGAVYKIVAQTFIPKTKDDIRLCRNEVDHIDGNRLNNNVNNLRWCTHEENINFPLARQNQFKSAKENGFKGRPPKKPVLQLERWNIHCVKGQTKNCWWIYVEIQGGATMKKIVVRKTQAPIEIMSTMGCRTQNGADVGAKECYYNNIKSVIMNGELVSDVHSASEKDGRGNICPVTIIMPTLAMMTKNHEVKTNDTIIGSDIKHCEEWDIEIFMTLLDQKIHEAKDMLLERFDYICSQPPESAKFMYENGTMAGYVPEEGIRSALKHGTLAIGQIGVAETLQILIGCDHTEERGMDLAIRIEQLFKDRCAEFKEEYKLNFGVYYSPAENLCHTSLKKFRDKYGVIENVSDRDFFTNSIHVPVWKKMSPYDKIDIESKLTGYSSAGCITYVELDSSISKNIEALEQIVNYAMDKDIPYFAVNVPNDTCMDCGYIGEFNNKCPECGSENIQQLRRVTGYLTGDYKTAFNKGKQQETEMRVKHGGYME